MIVIIPLRLIQPAPCFHFNGGAGVSLKPVISMQTKLPLPSLGNRYEFMNRYHLICILDSYRIGHGCLHLPAMIYWHRYTGLHVRAFIIERYNGSGWIPSLDGHCNYKCGSICCLLCTRRYLHGYSWSFDFVFWLVMDVWLSGNRRFRVVG